MYFCQIESQLLVDVVAVDDDIGQINRLHKIGILAFRLKLMVSSNRFNQPGGELQFSSQMGTDSGVVGRQLFLLGLKKGYMFIL